MATYSNRRRARSTYEYLIDRARAFTGIQGKNLGALWDDFEVAPTSTAISPPTWGNGGGGGAADTRVAGAKAGTRRMRTTAVAATSTEMYSQNFLVGRQGADPWYLAARVAAPTAYDAQGKCYVALHNSLGTLSCAFGVFGNVDTANWRVQHGGTYASPGTTVSTGVAATSTLVLIEMYCAADGVLRWRVNEGAEGQSTMSGPATDSSALVIGCRNGATAADRHLDIDYVLCAFSRA